MKRVNNIYSNIYSFDNALSVYKSIKSNMRNKKDLLIFNENLNQNLYNIITSLYNENYSFSNYKLFLIREPKYRLIMSSNVSDKIVNHLISNYILIPALEKSMIDTNVAARIGKGSNYAFNRLICYINKLRLSGNNIYVLKIDIKKFFYNIDHNILMNLLSNKIKDKKAINIIKNVINTTNNDYINKGIQKAVLTEIRRVKKLKISENEKKKRVNELNNIPLYECNKGLSIGNMTSQILSIFYLNDLDHYIKEKLLCKYYIRYMDDLIILSNEKDFLIEVLSFIKKELYKYKLVVNNKTNICCLKHGFNFLGYRFKYNDLLSVCCNKKTLSGVNKKLKYLYKFNYYKYILSLSSYKGYFSRQNNYYFD